MTDLEAPAGDSEDWSRIYRARGDEVTPNRPVFTGDVFVDVQVREPDGSMSAQDIMVAQHPCAMRTNGVELVPRLLVVEIGSYQALKPSQWTGHTRVMPLPDLHLEGPAEKRGHQAAFFNRIRVAAPEDLIQRVASLSPRGVNLLLQRWVYHNSRVVVPTADFDAAASGVYEEADLIEEWCDEHTERGTLLGDATAKCVAWLREDLGDGQTRQRMLEDPQSRSSIRAAMRAALRAAR